MNVTQAIRKARRLVQIIGYGHGDFVLHTWSQRHNAVFESHHMDYWHVRSAAKEAKIRVALEALGIEDAGAKANRLAQEDGGWDMLVRMFVKGALT